MDKINPQRYFIILTTVVAFVSIFSITRILSQAIFTSIVIAIVLYANQRHRTKKRKAKYAFLAQENYFSNTMLLLVAAVIKADDKKEDSEFRYIEQALLELYSPKRVMKMMKYIKHHVQETPIDYKKICRSVRMRFPLSSKIQLMHLLIGIATADGMMSKTESALLKDIAIHIRLPNATFQSIHKMFHFRYEGQEYKKRTGRVYSSKLRLSEAYTILEIDEIATVDQIKKAYRKLALKHHPDRVIHLGEEFQKSAKEKFQIVSDAYEYIKSRKGFS